MQRIKVGGPDLVGGGGGVGGLVGGGERLVCSKVGGSG